MHAILEQLHEDLNSYAEASIHIDTFNALELKVIQTGAFLRPLSIPGLSVLSQPKARIRLVSTGTSRRLRKAHRRELGYDDSAGALLRLTQSLDLTCLPQVYPHIDGINHVAKIALLAECDVSLVREAVSHLLWV